MTNLENALISEGLAENEKQANEIVRQMLSRIKGGFENAADVLEEYGLEGTDGEESLIDDIFNWKQYSESGSNNDSNPNTAPAKDEEKMMFKIKALIDKAESTDSQEEKDAFMMKAQQLIQQNNLSHERIMAVKGTRKADGTIVDEPIIEERVKYDDEWDRQLMENVATGNMCKCIFSAKSLQKIYIIGKASNVNSVVMLCDFYRKAILNLAMEAAKRKTRLSKTLYLSNGKKSIPTGELAKIEKEEIESISDYLFGAVAGLDDALRNKNRIFSEEVFTTENESGISSSISGREVMRCNTDKIQEYISKAYPHLGRASFSGGGNSNSMSYQRGHADGGGLGSGQRRLN